MMPLPSTTEITWWNANARPDDVALYVAGPTGLFQPQANQTKRGRRCAVWKDWTFSDPGGVAPISTMALGLSYVGYNPETGPTTPVTQIGDLVTWCARVKAVARSYGLPTLVAPDINGLQRWGADIAPYCDNVMLQVQRIEIDVPRTYAWVAQYSKILRDANPNIRVWAQVGATLDSLTEMRYALEEVSEIIDGWAFWESAPTFEVMTQFVAIVRGS